MLMTAIPDVDILDGLVICSMILIYFPDGTNVYGSRAVKCDGIWLV